MFITRGPVHQVNGCRGDTKLGGNRVDFLLGDLEIRFTVGGECGPTGKQEASGETGYECTACHVQ